MIIIMPVFFKLDGVWMAGPVADCISFIATAILIIIEMNRINKNEKNLAGLKENEVL
jgi:hypothetical protein